MVTIFLDFDGVLHPYPSKRGEKFSKVRLFEDTVKPYLYTIEIVISSAWRYDHSIHSLKKIFCKDIADRIVDTTHLLDYFYYHEHWRSKEIQEYLEKHPKDQILVIDDSQEAFSRKFQEKYPIVFTNRSFGLTHFECKQIDRFLRNFI